MAGSCPPSPSPPPPACTAAAPLLRAGRHGVRTQGMAHHMRVRHLCTGQRCRELPTPCCRARTRQHRHSVLHWAVQQCQDIHCLAATTPPLYALGGGAEGAGTPCRPYTSTGGPRPAPQGTASLPQQATLHAAGAPTAQVALPAASPATRSCCTCRPLRTLSSGQQPHQCGAWALPPANHPLLHVIAAAFKQQSLHVLLLLQLSPHSRHH
jgi:hypothetical protein